MTRFENGTKSPIIADTDRVLAAVRFLEGELRRNRVESAKVLLPLNMALMILVPSGERLRHGHARLLCAVEHLLIVRVEHRVQSTLIADLDANRRVLRPRRYRAWDVDEQRVVDRVVAAK